VPSTVQTMADESSGRSLQRGNPGVGCELGVCPKATSGAQYASQSAGSEEVDPAQLGQALESWLRQLANSRGEILSLRQGELKALCQPTYCRCTFDLKRLMAVARVFHERSEAHLRLQSRQSTVVLWIEASPPRREAIIREGTIGLDRRRPRGAVNE